MKDKKTEELKEEIKKFIETISGCKVAYIKLSIQNAERPHESR